MANDGESSLDETDREQFRRRLLDWYDRNRRDLPWRGVDSPYAVWVSEVMLQQTRVATVVDYFRRWMQRFPTVDTLADAEREQVMELWSGLGYYRRARFLHESARLVVDEFGGELPSTAEGLEQLKGVGPYTAGAIASIAFGQAAPVVDGNVERVLSRIFGIEGDPKATPNQNQYWRLADELIDCDRPGDFNQAMMELGATLCAPADAACMLCPVRAFCQGFAKGDPLAYPDTASRARQKPMTVHTAVVVRDVSEAECEFLLVKRPSEGLLAGLWEFPTVELEPEPTHLNGLDAYLAEQLGSMAAAEAQSVELGEFVHHFSHIRMTIRAEKRRVAAESTGIDPNDDFDRPLRWVSADQFGQMAVSAAMRKVFALLEDQ